MKVVSVIVPVYNVELYLDKCIKSICNQTYDELEIILVDDGATDTSGAMCDTYAQKDNRITVIHKSNGGLSDARNTGVKKATGEYLLFVDSDDYIHEQTVAEVVNEAEKRQADIVLYNFARVEGVFVEEYNCGIPICETMSLLTNPELLLVTPSACNRLFRRTFYIAQEIEFPMGRYYEDLGTIPKFMLKAGCISYVPKVLYYYCIREGSIMTGAKEQKICEDRIAMVNGVLRFYKAQGAYERYRLELEYLAFEHGYFLPSREIALTNHKSSALIQLKDYIIETYPDYQGNPYMKRLTRKEQLQLHALEQEKYMRLVWFSNVRKLFDMINGKSRKRVK